MKTTLAAVAGFILSLLILNPHMAISAEQRGTAKEAETLVKKAVSYIKANGKAKAFAEFGNKKGQFVDRDLYVFVYDLNGKCVAHGQNPKMVGNDLINMKDPDGRLFVKERVEIAKTKGKGWHNYKFTDPLTKKIEEKSAYVEKYEDLIVGSGIYKQ
ncbi:MAG: cache domain-containing protein [Thermodesulfovibrionales bacterium]